VLLGSGCDLLLSLDRDDPPVDPPGDAGGEPNVAFVSSQFVIPGELGGAAGADAKCQEFAGAAGLEGTYVAWVSTAIASARGRLAAANPRGWVRLDGLPFADTVDDLANRQTLYPLRITETNVDIATTSDDTQLEVVTGTGPDGLQVPGSTCADFTSEAGVVVVGKADAGSLEWTFTGTVSCSTPLRLYCFGVDRHVAVAPQPESTRIAFVTHGDVSASGGVNGLDRACEDEAASAGLPGTFRAAVAHPPDSIASMFPTGDPWVRFDGVTAISADFSATPAPVVFDAGGGRQDSAVALYGASSWTAATSAAETCDNWTSRFGNVVAGSPTRSSPRAYTGDPQTCSLAYRVYCLQQ